MIWLHLYRPATDRCHGSGLLSWTRWCFGCVDCGPAMAASMDVDDVPVWRC